ncbi:hypothetical protein WAK64_10720 [Bacillus spongiae]|uniref:Uncharacterized protein n=1 Tax=Bacillus spongiae TaxID=2683610 RepID=A0ABU8HE84_9BACI
MLTYRKEECASLLVAGQWSWTTPKSGGGRSASYKLGCIKERRLNTRRPVATPS